MATAVTIFGWRRHCNYGYKCYCLSQHQLGSSFFFVTGSYKAILVKNVKHLYKCTCMSEHKHTKKLAHLHCIR